jgi:predicted unusual protein kinase regulating ubiquinone biosynthesis (AarF/ABC1/UbiB family)
MADDDELPSGRIGRTARIGGLVAGQSLRWAGTRLANRRRTEEDADAARAARAVATADEIVAVLGQMKGAAMKFGQVLSMADFDGLPEAEREQFKAKLAALRDAAPSVPFAKMRKLVEADLGGPLGDFFAAFDETPVAAASIGQVHRARTLDGLDVAVKVQYPGVAEAVEADLRNAGLLLPLVKRMAPALDARALLRELRDRVGEELDYELEAQHQRTVARAFRDHPFVVVPAVHTALSARRVLTTDFVSGLGFEAVKRLDQAERDRFGEILFRFYFGLLHREHLAAGDPHPGNVLLCDDGRVCFLDFGLMRRVSPAYLDGERRLTTAVRSGDAAGVHAAMAELGYLPEPDTFDAHELLAQLNGEHSRDLMRRQTIPPESMLIRRMEMLLFRVLNDVDARCDWSALGRELRGGPPAGTELGDEEAAWLRGKSSHF